jgi:hypothetical protein
LLASNSDIMADLKRLRVTCGADACNLLLIDGAESTSLENALSARFNLGKAAFYLTRSDNHDDVVPLCSALPAGLEVTLHMVPDCNLEDPVVTLAAKRRKVQPEAAEVHTDDTCKVLCSIILQILMRDSSPSCYLNMSGDAMTCSPQAVRRSYFGVVGINPSALAHEYINESLRENCQRRTECSQEFLRIFRTSPHNRFQETLVDVAGPRMLLKPMWNAIPIMSDDVDQLEQSTGKTSTALAQVFSKAIFEPLLLTVQPTCLIVSGIPILEDLVSVGCCTVDRSCEMPMDLGTTNGCHKRVPQTGLLPYEQGKTEGGDKTDPRNCLGLIHYAHIWRDLHV